VYDYYEKHLQEHIVNYSKKTSHTAKSIKDNERQIIDWSIQMCNALTFLHEKRIIHRKLKASNIFIDRDNTVKIGDIGLTKATDITDVVPTKEDNVSALGIILLQLLTNNMYSEYDLTTPLILEEALKLIPNQYSPKWIQAVKGLLASPDTKWSLEKFTQYLGEIRDSLISQKDDDKMASETLLSIANMSPTIYNNDYDKVKKKRRG